VRVRILDHLRTKIDRLAGYRLVSSRAKLTFDQMQKERLVFFRGLYRQDDAEFARRAVNHRFAIVAQGSLVLPAHTKNRSRSRLKPLTKVLAERADLVHDRVAYPADRRDATNSKTTSTYGEMPSNTR
jgi:hypothetical protein